MKLNAHRYVDKRIEKQIEFYEQMGYEFVTSYQHFIVYASKKETEKLHTDEKIEKELIEKTRKRQIRLRILIPLTLILFMIIIMQSNRLFFLTISNNGILFMMMGLFLFMIGWFCYSYSIGKRKKKEMNAELRHIHLRSILGVLGNLFVIVYLLGCVYLFSYQMQMVIIFAVLLFSQFLFRFGIVNLSSQKEGKMKYLLMIINFIFFFIIYYQALESMNRLHEPVAYVTEKRTSYLHTESILLKNDQGKADYQNGYVYYDYYESKHHFIISYITIISVCIIHMVFRPEP